MLLTKELKKKLPKIGTHDGKDSSTVPVVVKFFSPWTQWVWYVTEGEKSGNDWVLYGLVRGWENELGYISLNELERARRGTLPLVERDMYFGKHMLSEAVEKRI
jgi:hypothetical protein